jgi:hypothetical protein
MTYNEIQQKILKEYQNGEFSHLCNPGTTQEDLENCGDGLLVFVIVELSDSEGCDTVDTAYDRIERAIEELTQIRDIIETGVEQKNILSIQLIHDMFGTDEALGVYFAAEEQSRFPDNSSAVVGTNFAQQVKNRLPDHAVEIVGFNGVDNPHCQVVKGWHEDGHDFAILDQQFLVDAWPKLVAGLNMKIAYDLKNPDDCRMVAEIYGDPQTWTDATKAVEDAHIWDRSGLKGVSEAFLALRQQAAEQHVDQPVTA